MNQKMYAFPVLYLAFPLCSQAAVFLDWKLFRFAL